MSPLTQLKKIGCRANLDACVNVVSEKTCTGGLGRSYINNVVNLSYKVDYYANGG